MIEVKSTARDDLFEINVTGTVSETDYTEVLIPSLEEAIARQDNIRLLVRFDEAFEDYTLGAVFEDARMGLKHWRGFDRIAVVAEKGWIGRIVRAFSVFLPCPVMVFPQAEYDDARRWLTESLGSIHQTELGGNVLHVQLLGKLDPAVYAEEEKDLDAFIRKHEKFRLLLDLREFDGWQGLGAVAQHFSLVRDHRQFVEKLAIVGTNEFERMAKRLAPLFVNAEVEYFSVDGFEGAKRWIKSW